MSGYSVDVKATHLTTDGAIFATDRIVQEALGGRGCFGRQVRVLQVARPFGQLTRHVVHLFTPLETNCGDRAVPQEVHSNILLDQGSVSAVENHSVTPQKVSPEPFPALVMPWLP